MRRFFSLSLPCLAVAVAAYGSGCSGSSGKSGATGGDGGGGGEDGGSTTPHALGTIMLGESHPPSGGSSTPVVLASFLPDASAVPSSCSSQIDGCSFVAPPQCGGAGSSCGQNETCAWDSACNATCTPACTLQCATGEECYFAAPGTPACRTTQTFDAGALAFAGTTTPITLFPPYDYTSSTSGSPFLAGAQIQVQASGATGAGFDAFDQTFTATSFLQTNPPIDKIPTTTIFGTGAIPIGWAPGSDTIEITVSGAGGTATCTAVDSSGSFQISRAVVSAALGPSGTSQLSISVTRERDVWDKSATTHGTLTTATVQPVGWLDLATSSTESASYQGCSDPSETMCPDGCYDTQSDQYHCGSCTVVCSANDVCVNGQCTTSGTSDDCDTCEQGAQTGTCASQTTTCEDDDGECTDYQSCAAACTSGDSTCLSTCESEYPTGYTDYTSYADCVCFTACPSQCATECSQ